MTRIICFEGIDGSGKTSQMGILKNKLEGLGKNVHCGSYPVYDSFFGKELGKLLSSKGPESALSVDPKSMALWYALDRWLDYQQNETGFQQADFVLLNRYTLSNVVYQALRAGEANVPASWITTLEQDVLGLPRPDFYLIFDLPPKLAKSNVIKKGTREYIDDQPDVYESDADLQSKVRDLYLEIANQMDDAEVVCCFRDERLLSPEVIAAGVWDVLRAARFV